MKLFQKLKEEICQEPAGCFAPAYYTYLGYARDFAAPPVTLRANGVCALFTLPDPVILKHELIAGNLHSLYSRADPLRLQYAQTQVRNVGGRTFTTNRDHFAPDYEQLLQLGLPGMIERIDVSLQTFRDDPQRQETLQAMRATLCAFREMIRKYAYAAKTCRHDSAYDPDRLDFIIQNCEAITSGKPRTFAQALQLVWFCHTAFRMEGRGAMALGRMDQYLYPFYQADRSQGTITDAQVEQLLENVFIRLEGDVVNICIGGQDPAGNCMINPLSRCILHAVNSCHVPGPNLSLRLTQNTPDEFLDECLQVIGTGLGYPALMNDDVNIAALKRYGYADEDLYNYCMVGCIENFITGMQPPWSDGRFDPPRYLDYVLNRGISQTHGSFGPDTGALEEMTSMEDFMEAFRKQLAQGAAEYVLQFNSVNDAINQKFFPEPFLSCFCRDCIGRGLDICNGGAVYPSVHGACLMGIGTTADALAAIEKVVFVDKAATLTQIRDAVNDNFEGWEPLRQKLLAAPKYGNNDPFADKYAVWFLEYLGSLFDRYKTRDGGGFYIAAAANTANILAGNKINATPDGRKRGEPLSDAASPTYGRDVCGITATVHSLTRPDYTLVATGSVVNQKYSPAMFTDQNRKLLLALIRTYFQKGGQELQINATSREVLEDAMAHPENYKNLVVRVSGFSAIYISLDKTVQQDILSRTQKDFI